jgi:biopolymer transport protein ExbD
MSQSVPEINTTPLIDVLLVLLVLMVITLPRMTHRISLDLPQGRSANQPAPVTNVEVDFDGRVFWNGAPVSDDRQLEQWFSAIAWTANSVRILPDRHARYERVAQVLASAQRAHISQLALLPVSD